MAQKGTEKFKETIKAYLDKLAESGDFALSYANPNKNLDECIDYILTQVKSSGCAGFTDDEIFGMAVHYYDEENPGEIKKGIGGQVVVNHHVELTEEEREDAKRKALDKITEEEVRKIKEKERKEKERKAKEAEAARVRAEEQRKKYETEDCLFSFDD